MPCAAVTLTQQLDSKDDVSIDGGLLCNPDVEVEASRCKEGQQEEQGPPAVVGQANHQCFVRFAWRSCCAFASQLHSSTGGNQAHSKADMQRCSTSWQSFNVQARELEQQ
jgi:hypothetical protein